MRYVSFTHPCRRRQLQLSQRFTLIKPGFSLVILRNVYDMQFLPKTQLFFQNQERLFTTAPYHDACGCLRGKNNSKLNKFLFWRTCTTHKINCNELKPAIADIAALSSKCSVRIYLGPRTWSCLHIDIVWLISLSRYWVNDCFVNQKRSGNPIVYFLKGSRSCVQARTQGGCIPPPDLKRCWHDTWFHWKSSTKYFCTAHHPLKMLKIDLC